MMMMMMMMMMYTEYIRASKDFSSKQRKMADLFNGVSIYSL